MSTTILTYLCAPCAEGRGLEVALGTRFVTGVCASCGARTKCLITTRPA